MKVYERHIRNLEAQAGNRTVWTVPFPPEAEIKKIIVVQTGGDTVGAFTVDLFNSKQVLIGSASSGGADPEGDYALDPDVYRVGPTLNSVGNELKQFYLDGGGLSYSNQDGGSSNKERKIYLEIEIPAGTGLTTWDVAIGARIDVG